MIINGSTNKLM